VTASNEHALAEIALEEEYSCKIAAVQRASLGNASLLPQEYAPLPQSPALEGQQRTMMRFDVLPQGGGLAIFLEARETHKVLGFLLTAQDQPEIG
jgi:hypothetical protein